MKRKTIFAALVAVLSLADVSTAQSLSLTVPDTVINDLDGDSTLFTESLWGQGKKVKIDFVKRGRDTTETLINYTGLDSPGGQLFEAALAASSHEACVANRDFSTAVPVGPERATLRYDSLTDTGTLRWFLPRNDSASCRVLIVRSANDSGDYAIWQSQFGSTAYRPFEQAGRSDSDQVNDGAPQRSRVTSLTVTFTAPVTL